MLGWMNIDMKAKDFRIGDDGNFKIGFSSLNALVGVNGAGKSFIMKFAWFTGYALQVYKAALMFTPKEVDASFEREVNNLFRYTFEEAEEFNGSVMVTDKDESIYRFIVSFKEGKLDYFNLDIMNPTAFEVGQLNQVRYNSKSARTFDQYETYIKLKKKFGITELTEKAVEELCDFYRIYDVLWFESVQRKVPEMVAGDISSFSGPESGDSIIGIVFTEDLELVSVKAKDDIPILVFSDGSERKTTSLSSGQQSMIMILAFQ